jgi:hypothetical protein
VYKVNIIDTYLRATEDEIAEGISWYDDTRALAIEWANGDVWKGAGVIAAYSPNTDWDRNLELAKDSLLTGVARTDALGMNVRKAQAILDGNEPLAVLNGPKTTAFASAIANPNSPLVTVDSHAYSIAIGKWTPTSKAKFGIRVYRSISEAYVECAELTGYSVSQFQAITWVSWRNRHPRKGRRG